MPAISVFDFYHIDQQEPVTNEDIEQAEEDLLYAEKNDCYGGWEKIEWASNRLRALQMLKKEQEGERKCMK